MGRERGSLGSGPRRMTIISLIATLALGQVGIGPGGAASPQGRITDGGVSGLRASGAINGNNLRITRAGRGGTLTINGNGNTVTVTGSLRSLLVSGNRNTVRLDAVRLITTPGNGNRVRYRKGSPGISDLGRGNRIARG